MTETIPIAGAIPHQKHTFNGELPTFFSQPMAPYLNAARDFIKVCGVDTILNCVEPTEGKSHGQTQIYEDRLLGALGDKGKELFQFLEPTQSTNGEEKARFIVSFGTDGSNQSYIVIFQGDSFYNKKPSKNKIYLHESGQVTLTKSERLGKRTIEAEFNENGDVTLLEDTFQTSGPEDLTVIYRHDETGKPRLYQVTMKEDMFGIELSLFPPDSSLQDLYEK